MNGKRKGWFKKKGADTVDLLTGLISCWELDEASASGTNVADANSLHDGTSNAVTKGETGILNKAYLFNSSTDYISVPDSNDFSMTDGANDLPFSISCWVNLNDLTPSSYFVSKFNATIREYWFHYNVTGELSFRPSSPTTGNYIITKLTNATSGLTINTWNHIVATYDGGGNASGLNIYFNGALLTQTRTEVGTYTGMVNGTEDLILGNISTSSTVYIHGLQDQTAIWKNRELTQIEVTELYNDGNGLAYTEWVGGFDADAQAFISAASITDSTQQTAINDLVVGLKANGLWTKMKAIYPFVGGTASTHKYNLKDPRDLDAAFRLTFSGTITHSSNGIVGNGINGFANTHFNEVNTTYFEDYHMSFYSRTNVSGNQVEIGTVGGAYLLYSFSGTRYCSFQSTESARGTLLTPTTGLLIGSRQSSTTEKYYFQGNLIDTQSVSSNNFLGPLVNIYLLCYNSGVGSPAQFSTKQCAFATIGNGLDDTDADNLETLVQAYQTTLGRQV